MLLTELIHFPLGEAFACEDCKQVGNRASACAHCGSQSIFSIASVLDRPQEIVAGIDPNFEQAFAGHIDPLALDLTERN